MTKKSIMFLLLFLIVSLSLSAEYLILKDGKKIKIDGTYKIEGQSVIFKMPGSDLEVALPLNKVDIEKTKAVNAVKETGSDEKKVKVFTNKDIKDQDKGSNSGEETNEGDETAVEEQGTDVQTVPSYLPEEIALRDNEWWTEEVTRVQNMLQESVKLNRKAINEYNDIIMLFNSKNDKERPAMKPQVDAKAAAIKQSQALIKSWYNAIQELHTIGVDAQKEEWLIKPLSQALENFKEIIE